ncbi:TetR/AcrR family transcriptional regulator [Geothrix sp. PMB-07]|uniref:TetR/AcrR family transcriptional regulator n=1 Tax=Geothrix sp. PMB-07 TaxID=3068640 RepID=UPI00274055E6|nr:TetR/AcrR family transcriptional regulator [Geothrix sp. PMB-07]WLT30106.1 TetR/AcrR family transcriptional regulator [Geothrix sp. PMB-07]
MPSKPPAPRRKPIQQRSLQTVDAILDSVVKILKRWGLEAVTTNRIAEVAGVSVGSIYQYFPDKRAIFTALHERHVEGICRLIDHTLRDHAATSLEAFVRALVEALIEAHETDPELHDLLSSEVPHGAQGARTYDLRLRGAFLVVLASESQSRHPPSHWKRKAFVLPHLVEALCHGALRNRPSGLPLKAAKEEAVQVVLSYLGR